MLPSLPTCQEAPAAQGNQQCWHKQGRNTFFCCSVSPSRLAAALLCPHEARRLWQRWKELSLSTGAQVGAGMGWRYRHRDLAVPGDVQLWPCWAGHSDVHSVCPLFVVSTSHKPSPSKGGSSASKSCFCKSYCLQPVDRHRGLSFHLLMLLSFSSLLINSHISHSISLPEIEVELTGL